MFNTPLGRKLYENMTTVGYYIMSGKASMYNDVIDMTNDFIKLNDGNIYFKKNMTMEEIEKLILYINDGTDYRFDIKVKTKSPFKTYIIALFTQHNIGFDDITNTSMIDVKINELENNFGIWNDANYDRITIVINTGLQDKSVLNIDVNLEDCK